MKKKETIFGAYPSSLIAQNYGEGDDNFHGYILWDISEPEVKHEFIEVPNRYSYKTVTINQFTDFDNLDIDIVNPTEFMRIRFVWNCFRAQHNTENLNKIRSYFKGKYGVIEFKDSKQYLNEDKVKVSEKNLKLENIYSLTTQEKIFTEYLTELGYEEDFIGDVLTHNETIAKRMPKEEESNITWKIVKLWGRNFRSFKDFEINFEEMNGIFQITGKNQVGKTTAYSLITYILFAKTAETETKQANGENRFINNRVEENFCLGGMVIDVDGNYYGIRRTSTRKLDRSGEVLKGIKSTFEVYKLNDPSDDFYDSNNIINLADDIKNQTQRVIDKITGDYDNFTRLVMTTSDSLNKILSLNKADFIDNILFNLGLDVFDKKLEEHKNFKKEYFVNHPKMNLNIESEESKIKGHLDNINLFENKKIEINKQIEELNIREKNGVDYKESLIKNLHQIDSELLNTSLDVLNVELRHNNELIEKKRELLVSNKRKIKELPKTFDDTVINSLNAEYDSCKKDIYDIKDLINDIKSVKNTIDNESNGFTTKIFLNEREIDKKNKLIAELEHSKTCPTCKQVLREEDLENIKIQISKENNSIKDLNKENDGFRDEIKSLEIKKKKTNVDIENYNEDIKNISVGMETIVIQKTEQENLKKLFDERELLITKNEKIILEGENIKNTIEKIENKISLYNANLTNIEENKKTDIKIEKAVNLLKELKDQILKLSNEYSYFSNQIENANTMIGDIEKSIKKFKSQLKNEEVLQAYESCIHRDGIPTMLLKKYSIPEINKNLEILLKDVPLNIWMDEETLTLKMTDMLNSDAIIDCLSGSGKERTFSAIALKFCLNELNIKSKPSMIILDEVTGKLVDESVDEFIDMLNILKKHVHNVIIIEHNHDIRPDHYIKIEKNKKGISEITEIY